MKSATLIESTELLLIFLIPVFLLAHCYFLSCYFFPTCPLFLFFLSLYSYCYPNELLPFFLFLFFPFVHCYFLSCYFFSYLPTVSFFPVTFFPVTFFPTWNCYFLSCYLFSCYFLSVHHIKDVHVLIMCLFTPAVQDAQHLFILKPIYYQQFYLRPLGHSCRSMCSSPGPLNHNSSPYVPPPQGRRAPSIYRLKVQHINFQSIWWKKDVFEITVKARASTSLLIGTDTYLALLMQKAEFLSGN